MKVQKEGMSPAQQQSVQIKQCFFIFLTHAYILVHILSLIIWHSFYKIYTHKHKHPIKQTPTNLT